MNIREHVIDLLPTPIEQGLIALVTDGTFKCAWGPLLHIDPTSKPERQLFEKVYEQAEVEFFLQEIKSNEYQRFVDIGGYVGLYTILFSHHANGAVDLFEPVPWNAARTKQNVLLNGYSNVNVHEKAVDDSPGEAQLVLSPELSIEASLRGDTYTGNHNRTLTVETTTLDDEFSSDSVELLKIDVEGNELPVLKGGSEILRTLPDLFIELHQSIMDNQCEELTEIGEILAEAGYRNVHHLESGSEFAPNALDRLSDEVGTPTHIFATDRGKTERLYRPNSN